MNDVEKSIALYTAMAERCEKTGLSSHQAAIYREMTDFIKDCATVEEVAAKIKKSKYFLAPSVALMLDRFEAHKKAAQEEDMPEIAEVYRKKTEEIAADPGAMYVTGYEATVRNYKIKYAQTVDAFVKIYRCYMIYMNVPATDKFRRGDALKDMKEALGNLILPSDDFFALAKLPKFRKLVPANDFGYEKFVQSVPKIVDGQMERSDESEIEQQQAKAEWEEVSRNKAQILEAGKKNLSRVRRAKVTVIAPDNADGHYRYVDEEVH